MTEQTLQIVRPKDPPYRIEAVEAYKPGAFPSELLGYQLGVTDAAGYIVWLMNNRVIYATPNEALQTLGTTPLTFTQPGFEHGRPTPEFTAWCGCFFVREVGG